MRIFCEKCERNVDTNVEKRKENYLVCGEQIEVDADVLLCSECGKELFCEGLDNVTLVKAYNKYRKKHKLLLPEEIKTIRVQYNLSQRSFAKLLNWGDKTIFRYENGSIQDKAHNAILLFLRQPENMEMYLRENEIQLSDKQKSKLLDNVEKLIQSKKHQKDSCTLAGQFAVIWMIQRGNFSAKQYKYRFPTGRRISYEFLLLFTDDKAY